MDTQFISRSPEASAQLNMLLTDQLYSKFRTARFVLPDHLMPAILRDVEFARSLWSV